MVQTEEPQEHKIQDVCVLFGSGGPELGVWCLSPLLGLDFGSSLSIHQPPDMFAGWLSDPRTTCTTASLWEGQVPRS